MAKVEVSPKPAIVTTGDPWASPKETWEYISIPEENSLGYKHDTISLNNHKFDAGETYLVPALVAESVKERLKVYSRACIRQLQPRRDTVSESQVAVGTSGGARAVDPSTLN